jgi:hypothetical protein
VPRIVKGGPTSGCIGDFKSFCFTNEQIILLNVSRYWGQRIWSDDFSVGVSSARNNIKTS